MSCNWGALGLSWSHVHSPKFDAGWKKTSVDTETMGKPTGDGSFSSTYSNLLL